MRKCFKTDATRIHAKEETVEKASKTLSLVAMQDRNTGVSKTFLKTIINH